MDIIDGLGYKWSPVRIFYKRKWYYLEFESTELRKVIAKYYEHIDDYKSYK